MIRSITNYGYGVRDISTIEMSFAFIDLPLALFVISYMMRGGLIYKQGDIDIMFAQKWRQHWGLSEDPFGCEDADKDIILTEVDASAVHSSFDRIYGNPKAPAPGIIFGEKGSGKSALRLMMSRRITQYNEAHPDEKTFLIEYIDFNTYIEQFRQRTGIRRQSQQAVRDVIDRWKIADHLDCILSLGVTKLVDEQLAQKKKPRNVSRKPIIDLLLFTSLYYNSDRLTVPKR